MATPQEKLDRRLVRAAGRGDIPAMTALLEKGANINGTGGLWQLYMTPLCHAASKGRRESIVFLLEHGADIDRADAWGYTPLATAILMSAPECVDELLTRGADAGIRDYKGRDALAFAAAQRKPRSREIILRHEAARRAAREKAREEERKKSTPPQEDPGVVIFRQHLGGRVLEDVFNFVSLERLTMVKSAENGPVETMLRENFADMRNRALLEKALAEHARRGGNVTEKDIFPDEKPKLRPPGDKP